MKFLKQENYVIGADFGSDSVRVVIVDAADGNTIASHVSYYPRWSKKLYCNIRENVFRQHPLDYIDSFTEAVQECVKNGKQYDTFLCEKVRAISVDTTGSTPAVADVNGTPLALTSSFAEDPDAMFILWKDHSAVCEAEEINTLAHCGDFPDYTQYTGGVYSSEWFWAKILHVVRSNSKVREYTYTAVEHCDWIVALLTDTQHPTRIHRSRCAAGHKCLWNESWNGYPPADFFAQLDNKLAEIVFTLGSVTYTAEDIAGGLCKEWADRLGLSMDIPICTGTYDAPAGFVGAGGAEHCMVKSIGTSTCDFLIGKKQETEKVIQGICGQVSDSVVKGWIGYEAGQSAYGDYYRWFRDIITWPCDNIPSFANLSDAMKSLILPALEKAAASIPVNENSPVALDWINGRRTPFANQTVKAGMLGLTLGTDAPAMMKMLLESTAFGSRAIIDCFENAGVYIKRVIATGGVAKKSPLGMQILADITGKDIYLAKVMQGAALGCAVYAAVAVHLYDSIFEAQTHMIPKGEKVYKPDPAKVRIYESLYEKYKRLAALSD